MGFYRKKLISFIMNNYCNLRCLYCPYFGKNGLFAQAGPQSISIKFARCGIKDFFEQTPYRAIRFMGIGEPTLDFKKMKDITEYANQMAGQKVYVELQTNGVFPERTAHWLGENASMIWISMDGLKNVQDYYRPRKDKRSSFEIVDRNIKILSGYRDALIGLRATIGQRNIKKQKEMIDYAKANNISTIYVEPLGPFDSCQDEAPAPVHFAEEIIENIKYAERIGVTYSTWALINFDEEVEISCRACLPMPHLLPDGYISSCDMANTGDTPLKDLIYGKYDESEDRIIYFDENIEKIKKRTIYNLPDTCRDCELLKHCAGGCVGAAYFNTKSLYQIDEKFCFLVKFLAGEFPEKINAGYDPKIPLHP